MLDWKILAIAGSLFYASFQSLSKLVPKTTSVFLITAYALLVGSIFMFLLNLLFTPNKSLALNSKSLLIAIGMGIMLSAGNFVTIKAYSLGAPQSIFSIIAYVVLIAMGILFGVILWHEKLTFPIILGTLISIAGILIIINYKK